MTDQPHDADFDPSEILMTLVVTVLAAIFLGVTGGNIAHARLAALATVNEYRARNHADLLAVAQIIAYGIAALGSLSLSMAEDLSLAMTLRLRNNANALDRSEHLREPVVVGRRPAPAPSRRPERGVPRRLSDARYLSLVWRQLLRSRFGHIFAMPTATNPRPKAPKSALRPALRSPRR